MEEKFTIRLNGMLTCVVAVLLGLQVLILVDLKHYQAEMVATLNEASASNDLAATNTTTTTTINTNSAPDADAEPSTVTRASDPSVCSATVKIRQLNQRSGPGESASILGAARSGAVFTGTGWDETQTWLLVNTTSGTAWMYAPYMTLAGDCANLPTYTNPVAATQTPLLSATTSAPAFQQPAATSTPVPQQAASSGTSSMNTLSPIFTPEVQYWADEISAWALAYQIDPNIIATVIQIESCGDPTVSSTAGAQGLFQVMPFHFAAGEDMLDIQTNARRGLDYLDGVLELSKGDVGLALAAYNGGYGIINGGWANETQRYYYWGSGIYAEALAGTTSPTLQEWLAAGGSRLCTSASQNQQTIR